MPLTCGLSGSHRWLITGVFCLPLLQVCALFSQNESVHAETVAQLSSARLGSTVSLGLNSQLRCFSTTGSYLVSGWDCEQPTRWTNSFSVRSRWTSRPPTTSPPRPRALHSCHFSHDRAPDLGSCIGTHQFNAFFSGRDSFLSLRLQKFLCLSVLLQQTRCWEVCVSAGSSLHAPLFVSPATFSSPLCFFFFFSLTQSKLHHLFQTCLQKPSDWAVSVCPLFSSPFTPTVTCVLQLLDRKLQSAVIVLPPGYKLVGLNYTVI